MTERARFWAKVRRLDSCWKWTGGTNKAGYGIFSVRVADGVVSYNAHRYAYEAVVGPIPIGLQIDHLCRNKWCVNPAHLEPVTGRVNTLRGKTIPAANAAKTHCPRGHAYDYVAPGGRYRGCLRCWRERLHPGEMVVPPGAANTLRAAFGKDGSA